jgi:hypothetical protein
MLPVPQLTHVAAVNSKAGNLAVLCSRQGVSVEAGEAGGAGGAGGAPLDMLVGRWERVYLRHRVYLATYLTPKYTR